MRGIRIGKTALLSVLTVVFLATLTSCKKTPTDSVETIPRIASGSFVGYGDMGDGPVNVWLAVLSEEDTSEVPVLSGFIQYENEREQLLSVTTNAAQDSFALQYSFNGVIHRATSAISIQGLDLEFSVPVGLANLRLNREIAGSNMTGKWLGTMLSNHLLTTSGATMIMDQWGLEFLGDIDTDFSAAMHADINGGTVTGADITLSGTGYYGSFSAGVLFWGQYMHQDTVAGNWRLATGDYEYDSGSFIFWRDF